jgi:hypothetical protein
MLPAAATWKTSIFFRGNARSSCGYAPKQRVNSDAASHLGTRNAILVVRVYETSKVWYGPRKEVQMTTISAIHGIIPRVSVMFHRIIFCLPGTSRSTGSFAFLSAFPSYGL